LLKSSIRVLISERINCILEALLVQEEKLMAF